MFSKKVLVIGSLLLAAIGFSPMYMAVISKNKEKKKLEFNPDYYKDKNEDIVK
ncbi:hypothetical protein ACWOAH_07315 [Vagococcus vulneris]|uniref:hypothetical protein n=1 Tax=Vagococcus vulneris TaxID=1977869 RepID=UPI0014031CD4|nr:hypothetical protein [Vagococcus vulneris]